MKSFSSFIIESRAAFNRAEREAEAAKRVQKAQEFTHISKEKANAKKQLAQQKLSDQRHKASKKKKQSQDHDEKYRQHTTAHNTKQVIKGTYRLGKHTARGVKNLIKKRNEQRRNNTP